MKEIQHHLPNLPFKLITSETDENLQKSDVLIVDVPCLLPILYEIPNVKWVQCTQAGVDQITPVVKKHGPLPYVLTRLADRFYASLVSEYVVHRIIHHERDFETVRNDQKAKLWSLEGKVGSYRSIFDLSFGLLGVGNIGVRTAECLDTFGATLYGFSSGRKRPKPKYFKRIFQKDKMPEFLRLCDYIVSILPETEATKNLLGCDMLENCKDRHTVFMNVGRGSVISDEDLIKALNCGWLQAAILDVFNTEPLPQDSPLWTMPKVFITPHVAAYKRPRDIARIFKDNYEFYKRNEPIPGTVDFQLGY